jgi:sulfite exporter TauE/SafE
MNWTALVSALALGLLGSAHCVAMCGGVVGLFCASNPIARGGAPPLHRMLAYHAGRVVSYAGAGFVVGGASALTLSAVPTISAQYALRFFAGVVMVVVGLSTAGVLRAPLRWRGASLRVAAWFRKLAAPWIPVRTTAQAMALGIVWGWMPCGLLYGALGIAVASGSSRSGALAMLVFGLATSPALLALGAAANWAARPLRSPRVRAGAGLLVALSGALNLVVVGEHAHWLPVRPAGLAVPDHCRSR